MNKLNERLTLIANLSVVVGSAAFHVSLRTAALPEQPADY